MGTRFHDILGSVADELERTAAAGAVLLGGGGARPEGGARYYSDPGGFAREAILWPSGHGPAPYQSEALNAIPERHRVSVRGPRGLGKTTLSALAILWFVITRDAAGVDWKVGTTAGAYTQLQHFLWPEIHKWARRIRWDVIGRKPWNTRTELLTMHIKLRYGEAFAASVDNPYLIEGAHADSVMFVFDESKAISTAVFNSVEGTFSNADTAGREAFALAMSTPGEPAGFFYNIHTRRPGTEQWWARHVTREEAIAAGQLSAKWCEERRLDWGEDSQLYNNHVLGQFWSADEDGVIPLSWVEAAIQRWHAWQAEGAVIPEEGFRTAGVDVARSGADKTVIALRAGPVVTEIRRAHREDTMATTGRVKAIVDADSSVVPVVDVIGIGAGVVDRLREMGVSSTVAFNASEGTSRKDSSGEVGFVNCRSAAWWNLREMLAPHSDEDVALPPDDLLIGDLTSPRYRLMSGGKIRIESKEDIAKRLGRSTDTGDATVQAFWPVSHTWATVYSVHNCEQCRRPFMTDINPDRCPHCKRAYRREPIAA